jgi:hypothetical protein
MRIIRRPVAVAIIAVVAASILGVRAAYATPAGDVLLADLLATSMKSLAQGAETLRNMQAQLDTARDTYEETKRYATLAHEAVETTKSFRTFSANRFGTAFTEDLRTAFPDVGYFSNEVASRGNLGRSYAGLDHALTYCLADYVQNKDACARLKSAAESDKLAAMVKATFGTERAAPARTKDEAQRRLIEDQLDQILTEAERERQLYEKLTTQLCELRSRCNNQYDSQCPNADLRKNSDCKDAAQTAQVLGLELQNLKQRADLRSQRLGALQLAQQNAAAQREADERANRHAILSSGADQLGATTKVKTGGFTFSDNDVR